MVCGFGVPPIYPSSSTLTRFPLPSTGSARDTFVGFIGSMGNSDFSDPIRVLCRNTYRCACAAFAPGDTAPRVAGLDHLLNGARTVLIHNGEPETSQVPGEPTRLPCPALRPRGVARIRHFNASPAAFHFENSVGLRT